MTCDYQLPGHRVPLELFVTDASADDVHAQYLSWDKYHDGALRVHRPSSGNHWNLLEQPQVDEIARVMLDSLRGAGGG